MDSISILAVIFFLLSVTMFFMLFYEMDQVAKLTQENVHLKMVIGELVEEMNDEGLEVSWWADDFAHKVEVSYKMEDGE